MEQLIYQNAVEGLFVKAFGKKMSPTLKKAIKAEGIDLDAPLKQAYPGEVVNRCTRLVRQHIYANEPDDDKAYYALGVAVLDGYFDTMLGRAMASVLRVIGFERVIDRLPQQMSSGTNYQHVTVQRTRPGEAIVHCSDCIPSAYINVGVLTRAFTHYFKAPEFKMEVVKVDETGATYRLNWKV